MAIQKLSLPTGPTVALEDTGGNGVPIIFSHDLYMDHNMFIPQVAAFRDTWRCISWDERAHGDTEWTGSFTYWDSARDLLAMMDALGIEKAVHVGMSQGGLLGMRAALLAPERFYGIVQLATQAGGVEPEGETIFRAFIADWQDNGKDAEAMQFLTDLILGPGVDTAYWHEYWSRFTRQRLDDAMSALFSIDLLYDRLHELKLPIAVIHGLADVATLPSLAMRVAREIPNPRGFSLIEGGPHGVNLSHPDEVNIAIQRFLNQLMAENTGMKGIA